MKGSSTSPTVLDDLEDFVESHRPHGRRYTEHRRCGGWGVVM